MYVNGIIIGQTVEGYMVSVYGLYPLTTGELTFQSGSLVEFK